MMRESRWRKLPGIRIDDNWASGTKNAMTWHGSGVPGSVYPVFLDSAAAIFHFDHFEWKILLRPGDEGEILRSGQPPISSRCPGITYWLFLGHILAFRLSIDELM
jgi:hypothetical protein